MIREYRQVDGPDCENEAHLTIAAVARPQRYGTCLKARALPPLSAVYRIGLSKSISGSRDRWLILRTKRLAGSLRYRAIGARIYTHVDETTQSVLAAVRRRLVVPPIHSPRSPPPSSTPAASTFIHHHRRTDGSRALTHTRVFRPRKIARISCGYHARERPTELVDKCNIGLHLSTNRACSE